MEFPAQMLNSTHGKRRLTARLKTATPSLLMSLLATGWLAPSAQAAVFSMLPLRQDPASGVFAASAVKCSEASDPLIIRQKEQGGEWCAKDVEGVCSSSKLGAAQKVCNYRAPREVSETQLAKTEPPKKVEAPKPVAVEVAPKAEVAAVKESKKASASSLAAEKDKLSIEAKRIAIEQQKLNLRKEELELQKQELSLKQANTEM